MNKNELLNELSEKIKAGDISRREVMSHFDDVSENHQNFSVTKMLYVLGIAIAIIGIGFFVHQIWHDIGSFGRISVTLGLGLLITAVGSFLNIKQLEGNIGAVFHFLGGILIPGGAIVTLSEFHIDTTTLWPFTASFGAILMFYVLLNFVHKSYVLTLFAIANGTAFIYLLVEAIVDGRFFDHTDLHAHVTMVMGVSYLLLGYAFRNGWNKKLVNVLYLFGITGFFGAAFSQVFNSVYWRILYFFLVFIGLLLSVYVKSRTILVMSTLFLIIHITYITNKYFADSLGWPICLVALGFIFIALGYVSIVINKKYIQPTPGAAERT